MFTTRPWLHEIRHKYPPATDTSTRWYLLCDTHVADTHRYHIRESRKYFICLFIWCLHRRTFYFPCILPSGEHLTHVACSSRHTPNHDDVFTSRGVKLPINVRHSVCLTSTALGRISFTCSFFKFSWFFILLVHEASSCIKLPLITRLINWWIRPPAD